jgi:hypothetical protein
VKRSVYLHEALLLIHSRLQVRAHSFSVQPAPKSRLIARLCLAARLQLILELCHHHVHQILLHCLHRQGRKELLSQARRTQPRPAGGAVRRRDNESAHLRDYEAA